MAAGAVLWETGAVRAVVDVTSGRLFEVLRANKSLARVDVDTLRQPCSIPACKLLANPCKHYFAADLFRCTGPYQRWQQAGSQGTRSVAANQARDDDSSPSSDSDGDQSDQDQNSDEESGTASQKDLQLSALFSFPQGSVEHEAPSGVVGDETEGTPVEAVEGSCRGLEQEQEPRVETSPALDDFSQSAVPRSSISFSICTWTAGLGVKSWPHPVAQASDVNFNKRSLSSADRDVSPLLREEVGGHTWNPFARQKMILLGPRLFWQRNDGRSEDDAL